MSGRLQRPMLFAVSCLTFALMASSLPERRCTKPEDCAVNECCLVGMSRFSIPRCVRHQRVGESCLMGAEAENKTLYYPNGKVINVYGAHRLFCPCEAGVGCLKAVCQPMSSEELTRSAVYNIDNFDYSALDDFSGKQDNYVEFA